MSLLPTWLSSCGLDHLQSVFAAYGVRDESFTDLQFQDYDAMGIFEPPERQKLFKLIQQVKRAQASQAAQQQQQAIIQQQQLQQQQQQQQIQQQQQLEQQRLVEQQRQQQIQQQQQQSMQSMPPPRVAVPRQSMANNQSLSSPTNTPHSRRIDSLSQPRDRAVINRALNEQNNQSNAPQQQPPQASQGHRQRKANASQYNMQNVNQPPQSYNDDNPSNDDSYANNQSESYNDNDGETEDAEDDDATGQSSALATDSEIDFGSKIRVAVRKRPINSKERTKGEMDVATVASQVHSVTIHEPKVKVDLTKYVESHRFTFDEVFDETANNEEIYSTTCRPLIEFFLRAGKATCFAYGQTGSGKTHTMMGPSDQGTTGMYAFAARDIFETINNRPEFGDLQIYVSFFEIYGGKLFDLLNDRGKLLCREDGQKMVNIIGLTEKHIQNHQELLDVIHYGNTVRSTGSTGANIDSSRSHAILQMDAKRWVKKEGYKSKLKLHGRFSFIDLAGSERAADTSDNDRRTRLEGAEINKSLLALKECIRALDQGGKHLPFRGSQLTQVLKDSFIGNSRTIMIANISPNSGSCEHTLNTLRYADRVKELKGQVADVAPKAKKAGFDAYMPHQGSKANVKVRQGAIDTRDDINENINSGIRPPGAQPPPQSQPRMSIAPQNVSSTPNKRVNPNPSNFQSQQQQPQQQPTAPQYNPPGDDEQYDDDDTESMQSTYSDLCSAILVEEDHIVDAHRAQIDSTMKQVKEEMELLKQHDSQQMSVDEYVMALDALLVKKMDSIAGLREKLAVFRTHLQEEQQLSSSLTRVSQGRDPSQFDEEEKAAPRRPSQIPNRPYTRNQ